MQKNIAMSEKDKSPFFIVGCVRSGTTMMRNVLRTHKEFVSPEETHFYRWGHPFGTKAYFNNNIRNLTLKKHRRLDGISEEEFMKMLESSFSRKELYDKYMNAFAVTKNRKDFRWFDKTPQNVYGLAMLAQDFKESKFIHIVRNPLNVTASLKIGKVMKIARLSAAISYWIEAIQIVDVIAPFLGDRLYTVKYEDLTSNPEIEMNKICAFLDTDSKLIGYDYSTIYPEKNKYLKVLDNQEIDKIISNCSNLMANFNYALASHKKEVPAKG